MVESNSKLLSDHSKPVLSIPFLGKYSVTAAGTISDDNGTQKTDVVGRSCKTGLQLLSATLL